MAAHQRTHTHRGVDFVVVPGSERERILLDLFQAEDRLAQRPGFAEDVNDLVRVLAPSLILGALGGLVGGGLVWLVGWLI